MILCRLLGLIIVAGDIVFTVRNPINLPELCSFVLVLGGTVAAKLISYPLCKEF